LPQHVCECGGTFGFLEGRSFNFRNLGNFANESFVIFGYKVLGRLKLGRHDDALNIYRLSGRGGKEEYNE
jgi:hypothetical protein